MKMISFVSFKGGAGKSTALMAVASALVSQGKRIALFEADENRPLRRWKENAKEIGTWDDDLCLVLSADSFEAMQSSFETAESANCDYILVDTAGGASELNSTIIANSDKAIIPTSLNMIDLDEALSTLVFVSVQVSKIKGSQIDTKLLLTKFPQSNLKSSERLNLEAIEAMPQFRNRIQSRNAFASIKGLGLLHIHLENLNSNPKYRILSSHIRVALSESIELSNEIFGEAV